MKTNISLERCQSFIQSQFKPAHARTLSQTRNARRVITISRQAGSGGHPVADKLVEFLAADTPKGTRPWTVFDRNLVERVLEDHNLPKALAKFMPEDRMSEITDTMDELFGLHPPSWTLVHKTVDTILRLAQLGNVIIIGRGANVILGNTEEAFHVRLVGSLEHRAKAFAQTAHVSEKEALRKVQHEDLGRKRYLRKYFNKDIEDPLLYHLVINTDLIAVEEAARMIADAVSPTSDAAA